MMSPAIQLETLLSRSMLPSIDESQLIYILISPTTNESSELSPTQSRLPVNLGLVIDQSSSMRGERLSQVKEAAHLIVDQMQEGDYLSVVTFHDRATVVIPAQRIHETDHSQLKWLINDIEAMGGTEMARGIESSLKELAHPSFQGLKHMLLLTDGRTYGDDDRCVQLARLAQERSVGITALGIGDEWNEDLLEEMTAQENSYTHYVTAASEIPTMFIEEIHRIHATFARGVQLLIEGRCDCTVRSFDRVQPYITPITLRGERNIRWLVNLGNWSADEKQAFLMEVVVPPLSVGDHHLLQLTLRYDITGAKKSKEEYFESRLDISVRPEQFVDSLIDEKVKQWVARLVAYRLQLQAWQNIKDGDSDQAAKQLQMAGTRLLHVGEVDLARMMQQEASQVARSGNVSASGRKYIKFGTRGLVRSSSSDMLIKP